MIGATLVVAYWDWAEARLLRLVRPDSAPDAIGAATHEYYCPMHPNVIRATPASCPICGMPLAKRKVGADVPSGEAAARLRLTPERLRLAGIATVEVGRRPLEKVIETVGFVELDERRLARITARVRGRVDRLFVDFTGSQVRKGDPLVSIYSQDVYTTARQLIGDRQAGRQDALASRERLLLWGLLPEQVERIERSARPETHIEVVSPMSGTVIARKVVAGDYVSEGTELYTVADLSLVWLVAKVFEDEIAFTHIGAPVAIRTVAYPGRIFEGRVSFVDPLLDAETRTVRVRVDVPNPEGLLKPGMYATARLQVPIGTRGEPAVAGDVVYRCCTSCPEVQSDKPGACPKCGMPLTPVERGAPPPAGCKAEGTPECACEDAAGKGAAEAAGASASASASKSTTVYECPMHPEATRTEPGECAACGGMKLIPRVVNVSAPKDPRPSGPVVVPVTAVVDTGGRHVVYREVEPGAFEPVEVTLGPRTGEYYPVIAGIAEGARVVARGTFLVDAEARLNPGAASSYFGASGGPQAGQGAAQGARKP